MSDALKKLESLLLEAFEEQKKCKDTLLAHLMDREIEHLLNVRDALLELELLKHMQPEKRNEGTKHFRAMPPH